MENNEQDTNDINFDNRIPLEGLQKAVSDIK